MDEIEALILGGKSEVKPSKQASVITDELLDRLRFTESGKDKFALNKETKAMGPYQFMPETVQMLHKQGYKFNPFDEVEARDMARTYLKTLTQRNKGDVNKALAQYGGFVTKDPSQYIAKIIGPQTTPVAKTQQTPQFEQPTDEVEALILGKPSEAQPAAESKRNVPRISELGRSAAGLADTVLGSIQALPGTAAAEIGYAGARAAEGIGLVKPGTAERGRAAVYKEYVEPYQKPVGKLFGVSETPEYKGEASQQFADFVAKNIDKGADWISQQTGIPKTDVENMVGTLMVGAGPKVGKVAAQAAKPVVAAAETTLETAGKVKPAISEMFEKRKGMGGSTAGAAQATQENIRVAKAQDLPFPIQLEKSQVTRNPADVRFARETAKDPVLGGPFQERYAQQNDLIQKNLDAFVERTGAELSGVAPAEFGQILSDLVSKEKTRRYSEVSQAYEKARTAGETAEMVDVGNLSKWVKDNASASKNAPVISTVSSEIKRLSKDGKISINDLEEVRKLVNEVRDDSAVNNRFGKKAIDVIDKITEGKGGDLYKEARALNTSFMTEFENTPVLRNITAIKRGTTQRVVDVADLADKLMLKSTGADVRQLFASLDKLGPEGQQMANELRGYVAQHIRDEATKGVQLDINGKPYVSTKNLDTTLKKLDKSGKLEFLFGKQAAQQYRTLNDVVKDIQTVPQGTVNPSGTAASLKAMMYPLAEMAVQQSVTGIPAPVIWAGKQVLDIRKQHKEINKIQDFLNYGKPKE